MPSAIQSNFARNGNSLIKLCRILYIKRFERYCNYDLVLSNMETHMQANICTPKPIGSPVSCRFRIWRNKNPFREKKIELYTCHKIPSQVITGASISSFYVLKAHKAEVWGYFKSACDRNVNFKVLKSQCN